MQVHGDELRVSFSGVKLHVNVGFYNPPVSRFTVNKKAHQWVGTTCRGPTGGRVLEGVFKLPRSPPQARKFGHYLLEITAVYTVRMPDHKQTIVPRLNAQTTIFAIRLTKSVVNY